MRTLTLCNWQPAFQQMNHASDNPPPHSTHRAWRVAVLEDGVRHHESIIGPGLEFFGFEVIGAVSAAELHRRVRSSHVDMVVLDVGVPGENAMDVLGALRNHAALGIVVIMESATERNHLAALSRGADAVLKQPVDMEVLAATLHSIGRRVVMQRHDMVAARPSGYWQLDTEGWCLITPSGKSVPLTAPERCILRTLMERSDQPLSRDHLVGALTDAVSEFDPGRMEIVVHRLRRKARVAAGVTLPLATVRGYGYVFQETT